MIKLCVQVFIVYISVCVCVCVGSLCMLTVDFVLHCGQYAT